MLPCIFLMPLTFKAEWWAAASWRRRQGFMFAGLVGELFAQAPLHCAAAQVLRRLVGFFAVLAVDVFVLLADFVVMELLATWSLLSSAPE